MVTSHPRRIVAFRAKIATNPAGWGRHPREIVASATVHATILTA
jgi:hypothetical protein